MTSSSSRSRSARRRCETASTRCPTARASASEKPGTQARFRGGEGGGRLGRRLHRGGARQPRHRLPPGTSPRASGTTTTCATSHSWPTRPTARLARRRRADASGAHGENRETRIPAPAPSQIASDFSGVDAEGDGASTTSSASGTTGCAPRSASRDAGFDIVYVYGGHSYLPASSCRRSTTSARTSTAARSRTARASGSRCSRRSARRSATTARSRAARDRGRSGGGRRARRRASSSCASPTTSSTSGTSTSGSIPELVEGLGRVALLPGGLPARVDRAGARGDREADRRRRPPDEPGPHGGDHPSRAHGT